MSATPAASSIHIGTSGWMYKHWKGGFYPEKLPTSRWLAFYQEHFDTVELNGSFYRQPKAETFRNWREKSPSKFLWALKAYRGITHFYRLRRRESLDRFLEAAAALDSSWAVTLFQLPPQLRFESESLERFLDWLPKHARCAFEPRHASWFGELPLRLLEQHHVALAICDSGGRFPSCERLTAPFVYLRFHGPQGDFGSSYAASFLKSWARKLLEWKREAFVYFNNDAQGHAIANARTLQRQVAKLAGQR